MQGCSIQGCVREAKVKGMCKPHYVASWKKENVSIEKREGNDLYAVWCSKRKNRVAEWESFETFKADIGPKPSENHKLRKINAKLPFGPTNVEWRLTFVPKNDGESLDAYKSRAMRAHNLRYKYGITREEYDAMLAAQNGGCDICKRKESSIISGKVMELAVDHDHKTGKVRALLCSTCNTSLGGFQDDISLLQVAIEYLRKHAPKE